MTIRARKFDAKVLISAPRRDAGVPNKDGSQVLYAISQYSFEEHDTKREIRLLDVKSDESRVVDDSGKCSEPVWLDEDTIAMLRSTDEGETELVVGKAENFKERCIGRLTYRRLED